MLHRDRVGVLVQGELLAQLDQLGVGEEVEGFDGGQALRLEPGGKGSFPHHYAFNCLIWGFCSLGSWIEVCIEDIYRISGVDRSRWMV